MDLASISIVCWWKNALFLSLRWREAQCSVTLFCFLHQSKKLCPTKPFAENNVCLQNTVFLSGVLCTLVSHYPQTKVMEIL